ncbi:hypothetical protein D3C76_651570 [compost metagenome]
MPRDGLYRKPNELAPPIIKVEASSAKCLKGAVTRTFSMRRGSIEAGARLTFISRWYCSVVKVPC